MNKTLAVAVGAAFGAAAACPLTASAATYDFSFNGGGVEGSITLTYGAATDARYSQAMEVTGISGTFSDANIAIVNAPILGLVPVNHATPEDTNLLAPNDFSRFAVAEGTTPESGGFLTFDNLFWPGGSPATATDYPAAGGLLDIYGLMFRIGNGRVVDLWSNGIFGPPGSAPILYGVGVATVDSMLDYVDSGVSAVPEPASFGLMLGGLGLLAVTLRRRANL
ncbi:MAG: PEP-CTERM sorting domain-containing protein [Pseudomonadota bacterium]|nr:PEP-CTERM sorting domain-containing protein [Pseudomonadota bacterium]